MTSLRSALPIAIFSIRHISQRSVSHLGLTVEQSGLLVQKVAHLGGHLCIRIVVHSRRMSLSAEAGWSIVNTEPEGTTDVTKLGMEPDKLQPLQALHAYPEFTL
jgi:hypothetical protein